jgi:hypothetical protein
MLRPQILSKSRNPFLISATATSTQTMTTYRKALTTTTMTQLSVFNHSKCLDDYIECGGVCSLNPEA